ncbi:MFS transporter [Belnapia rosea]|uniref:Predicted arabinose efflux permease, MFS family n=1 Tax=Belnapia rosea TaxID=938405 RepID=A0A1G6ZBZ5_9PROT|nr:MFS transporter [Belnapia rosea]SDB35225.1 Predicted arabinose efflux permease, MFS family [Belnapia rosea]SDD99246.1 Predicted arabinose efflux permease, MFS family [Belnapia rosea]
MPPAIPITLLALAGFTTGAGMRMLDPLLPAIAAAFGVTVAHAAAVVAAFVLPYGLVQLVAGPLGDRLGKVRIACGAVLLFGLGLVASAFATGLPGLIALRAWSGCFAGAVIPLLMAHIADSVPYAERQVAISRFLTGMVMAQLLAGPVSGMVAEAVDWRLPFLLLGALALTVSGVLAWRLGASLWRRPEGATGGRGMGAYLDLLRKPSGRWLMGLAFFDGFWLFGGAFPFVGSFLIEGFGRNAAEAGLIVAGFGLGAFAYTRMARPLLARFGERGLLIVGGGSIAVALGLLAVAPAWPVVAALQVVMGLAFYMFHGVLQTRATEALPEARGTAVGAFALALFLGQSAGSLAFGLALVAIDYRGAFALAGCGVVALALAARANSPRG